MDTNTEYPKGPRKRQRSTSHGSGASPADELAAARIRGELVARGLSLRTWAFTWGRAQGISCPDELERTYRTVRMTVARWAHRSDNPPHKWSLSRRIMEDLRRDLGNTFHERDRA